MHSTQNVTQMSPKVHRRQGSKFQIFYHIRTCGSIPHPAISFMKFYFFGHGAFHVSYFSAVSSVYLFYFPHFSNDFTFSRFSCFTFSHAFRVSHFSFRVFHIFHVFHVFHRCHFHVFHICRIREIRFEFKWWMCSYPSPRIFPGFGIRILRSGFRVFDPDFLHWALRRVVVVLILIFNCLLNDFKRRRDRLNPAGPNLAI
jgi:hypothetical protein